MKVLTLAERYFHCIEFEHNTVKGRFIYEFGMFEEKSLKAATTTKKLLIETKFILQRAVQTLKTQIKTDFRCMITFIIIQSNYSFDD